MRKRNIIATDSCLQINNQQVRQKQKAEEPHGIHHFRLIIDKIPLID